MEFLRATMSPHIKAIQTKTWCFCLYGNKLAQMISQFLVEFKLPFNIKIIHFLSRYIYIFFLFLYFFAHRTVSSGILSFRRFTFNFLPPTYLFCDILPQYKQTVRCVDFISDIDECFENTHNCSKGNATCTNTEGYFTCSCNPGFTGDGYNCTGNTS